MNRSGLAVVALVCLALTATAATAGAQKRDPKRRVEVLAFSQGGCNSAPVRATAKKLRGAFERCAAANQGKYTLTFASSAAGKATKPKGNPDGTLPAEVQRCIDARIEGAGWPKAKFCDIEITVIVK